MRKRIKLLINHNKILLFICVPVTSLALGHERFFSYEILRNYLVFKSINDGNRLYFGFKDFTTLLWL
jgi:hypothetical protein